MRRERADLHAGAYATLPAPDDAWAYARGDGTVVALNLSDGPLKVADITGEVLLATDGARSGRFDGTLAPWSGAVIARDA